MPDKKIVVTSTGEARWIHDDRTTELLSGLGGTPTIRRASHVEQWSDLSMQAQAVFLGISYDTYTDPLSFRYPHPHFSGWFADLTPVKGPVLGPYHYRDEALVAEVGWLTEHGIPNSTDTETVNSVK